MDNQIKSNIHPQYFINYINCKSFNQSRFNTYNNLILFNKNGCLKIFYK